MKKMVIMAGMTLGVFVLTGCGSEAGGGEKQMTSTEFNTKVQGAWLKTKGGKVCVNDTKSNTSQKVAISFQRKGGFQTAVKKYSEYDCHEDDLSFAAVWYYDYSFGAQSEANDTQLAAKLPYVFPLDVTYVEMNLTKGSLDNPVDSAGTKYYLMAGIRADGNLEFAYNAKGKAMTKIRSERPHTFALNDEWVWVKAKK